MSRVAGRGIQGDGKGRSWLCAGGVNSAMRGSGIGGVSGNVEYGRREGSTGRCAAVRQMKGRRGVLTWRRRGQ